MQNWLFDHLKDGFDLFQFLDTLDMGAYVVDPGRRIVYWNTKAAQITGFGPGDVVGSTCHDRVLNHRDRMGIEICKSDLCPLVRSMKIRRTIDLPYSMYARSRQGGNLPLKIMTFPLMEKGKVIGGVELFDVAEPRSQDMMMATNIQHALIPRELPEDVRVFYYPSDYIGGDLIFVNANWIGLVDVSGHGVSSALISSGMRVLLGEILTAELDIRDLGNLLEDRFRQFGETGMHCTGIFARRVVGGFQIASFGHPEPIKKRADGSTTPLEVDYDVLIGWGKEHRRNFRFEPMEPGESLLFYSDGITEITGERGPLETEGLAEIFSGVDALQDIYIRSMSDSLQEVHTDDISMILVQAGNESSPFLFPS